LLARSLTGTIVVVGADRIEGARCAAAAGAAAVILDDGFQHRRLARDLDIVALDGRAPFADGHLVPRGFLRELPGALRRAHVVVLTRLREGDPARGAVDAVRSSGFSGPIIRAGHRTTGFEDASGAACAAPRRALAFCGIGDPQLFRADLEAAGVVTAGFHAFRDHQPYTLADWEKLLAEGRALRVPLITTEKDLSRIEAAGAALNGSPLVVARMETLVWDEALLLDAVRRTVATRGGSVT
jgi:tetraacyldisaccharide 4'-kinase